jgi:NADPH2:quinone reductase
MDEWGGAPRIGEFDEPRAGDGNVVVTVEAAGINPVDQVVWSGNVPVPPQLGSVVGREAVGRTKDGRRVYFSNAVPPYGAFAERALIDPERAYTVPESVDAGAAAAIGIAGIAAWTPLEWRADLQEGETVVVLGASGVVGQIGVQVAKLLGAGRVVAVARNEAGLARAAELGADATVRIGDGDLGAAIRDATDGGADVILDPLWGEPAAAALKAVRAGARLVQVGHSAGPSAPIVPSPLRPLIADIRFHGASGVPDDVKRLAYEQMADHLVAGDLVVDVEKVPLDDVADAWQRQREFPHHKLVLVP